MAVHVTNAVIPRISSLGGGMWSITGLTELTVLFGRNGSGKSAMLRSWRDQSPENIHYVTPERTGEMDLQPQFMREELEPAGRKNASSRNYMPDYRRRIVARIQAYFMSRGNYRGIDKAPGHPDVIESLINGLLTDFNIMVEGSAVLPYKLTRLDSGQVVSSVDQLSSGEAQLVTIGLDILTIASMWEVNKQGNRIMLVDEPDAHIHPDLQVRFADFLFQVVDKFSLQVVIATHSVSLLAALGQFGGARTSVAYINRKKLNHVTQTFGSVQKELSACLGGHVLMGPLFGSPILLVEGDDDYRTWSQVPRHHVASLAVIPTNGDEIRQYQKTLEQIFASLREQDDTPCGFALLDGDKSLPVANPDNPQKNIRFLKLACRECENLYLVDEVLADIGTTWPEAQAKITGAAATFGNKQASLLAIAVSDRQVVDLKPAINELVAILDAKHVHWTMRVGRVLGRTKPVGQLAIFLGAEVVAALWPADA